MSIETIASTRDALGYLVSQNKRLLMALVQRPGTAQAFMQFLTGIDRWSETRGVPYERIGYRAMLMRDGSFALRLYDTEVGKDGDSDERWVPETDMEADMEPNREG